LPINTPPALITPIRTDIINAKTLSVKKKEGYTMTGATVPFQFFGNLDDLKIDEMGPAERH
jgi:hypothetical protein